jgi:predicted anti-sigma-YlaC factor YlaD
MTRRITVSLPDDVAQYLDKHPNSSAIVTEAVRSHMQRGATTRAMLEAAGFAITDEGVARWRDKLRPPTEAQKAESRRRLEAMKAGRWPDTEEPA